MNDNKRQMKSLLHLNYSIGMCVCAHTHKNLGELLAWKLLKS